MPESATAVTAILDQPTLEAWAYAVGGRVAAGAVAPPLVVALRGPLGAGKSVLARAVARGAGVSSPMPSPTYNLVFTYDGRGVRVFHLDLYRLERPDDVWELGWQELGEGSQVVLIEWPDRAEELLPPDRWEAELSFVDGDASLRRLAVRRLGTAPEVPGPGDGTGRVRGGAVIRVAIETATRVGSVAVGRDDRVLAEVTLGVQTRHAESALPALDAALRMAGVERSGVGAVVVGAGPGSFTGVRVAGATAKALATSLDVPLLAYSSLLALAVDGAGGAPAGAVICGLFDARRGEVYGGAWVVGGLGGVAEAGGPAGPGGSGVGLVLAPCVGAVEEVVARLAERLGRRGGGDGRAVMFVGEGVARYGAELRAACRAEGVDAGLAARAARPRAEGLLWLAHHDPGAGAVADVAAWEPAYVRGSSAERGIPG